MSKILNKLLYSKYAIKEDYKFADPIDQVDDISLVRLAAMETVNAEDADVYFNTAVLGGVVAYHIPDGKRFIALKLKAVKEQATADDDTIVKLCINNTEKALAYLGVNGGALLDEYPILGDDGSYLGADGAEVAFTSTHATEKVDSVAHGLLDGQVIKFTGADLPDGWSADTPYFIVSKGDDDFEVSLTPGGAAVTIADDGTGTMTYRTIEYLNMRARNIADSKDVDLNIELWGIVFTPKS